MSEMDDMTWLVTMLRSDNPKVRNDGLMANFRIGEGSIYALAACLNHADSERHAHTRELATAILWRAEIKKDAP